MLCHQLFIQTENTSIGCRSTPGPAVLPLVHRPQPPQSPGENINMIYALKSQHIPDSERRRIARLISDGRAAALAQDDRVIHVCDTKAGEKYHCVYCCRTVRKWCKLESVRFDHDVNQGCLGSDQGLPGITNPHRVTTYCLEP